MFDLNNISEGENTIYLEDGQFLDQVKTSFHDFSKGLPVGILNKQYTGIGATTAEFNSNRKSIIVFPYRKIAQEKYNKWKESKKAFYVGSDENNKSPQPDEIALYIRNNINEDIKFCVVADSIDKVVEGIKKAGLLPYDDTFFLVLDEVEILQLQSGFRGRLPICFEYFKKFPKKCLVSATLLDFSDAEIKKLPVFNVEKVSYDLEIGHVNYVEDLDFKQYKTNHPHIEVAQDIIAFYEKSPSHEQYKFFIGLNSKEAIKQFIDEIESKNPSLTISVIASEQSSDDFFSKYTKSRIVKGKLPCHINLSTCIAWSAIDLEEQFFSIAISLNDEIHHSFSFENLIQFFGRCRLPKELQLSKTLVVGKDTALKYERPYGDYIERINNLDSLIKFIDNKITSKTDKKHIYSALLESKYNLIFSDIKGKPKVNWLLKDLEQYTSNVVDDYTDISNGLLNKLENRYVIHARETLFREIEVYEMSSKEKLEEKLEILLGNFNEDYPDKRLIKQIRRKNNPTLRVAAFWYFFGRKILKGDAQGLKLAKHYSGFESNLPENGVSTITKMTLDSIYLYHYESELWGDLLNQMKTICKGGKKKRARDFIGIFQSQKFSSYFPSIVYSNSPTTSVGSFIKYILGISNSGKSGGTETFMIEDNKKYIPIIFTIYPNLKSNLCKVPKFAKGKGGISFGKTSIQNFLQEDFKLNIE